MDNWTCIKMVKFPFEFIILKMFIAETYPFRENLLNFASFSLFAKMEKTVFVSTLPVTGYIIFVLPIPNYNFICVLIIRC
jgi:hypothetical protein